MCSKSGIITDSSRVKHFFADGDFDEKCYNGWEYDLRLGDEFYTTTEDMPIILKDDKPYAIIRPGDFALLITKEFLIMPMDVMAFISIKFSYKQKGLINISGFHVDPGYKGKIIFSVYNAGPNDIILRKNDPVFMIFFMELDKELTGKKPSINSYNSLPVQMISSIRGKSVSLATNAERIDRLEHYVKFYGAIAFSIIILLLGAIVKKWF